MHIDAAPSGPGPFLLSSSSLLNVRRPEPEQAEHVGEDDEEVTVTVSLAVTEQVTYEFETEAIEPPNRNRRLDFLRRVLTSEKINTLAYYRPIAEGTPSGATSSCVQISTNSRPCADPAGTNRIRPRPTQPDRRAGLGGHQRFRDR
ncbi:hypothetical protein ACFCX0_30845 [Streptomyces sp. NPDC056352]|uniref:hypothetical protein n=1 Tax=Streptomyces sp. NPDC056352 TaxID=3345791 RepID=UPI0035E20E62